MLVSWKSESFLWLELYGQRKQIQLKVLSLLKFHLEELFLAPFYSGFSALFLIIFFFSRQWKLIIPIYFQVYAM